MGHVQSVVTIKEPGIPWPFETISFIADGIDADIRDRNIGYRKQEV